MSDSESVPELAEVDESSIEDTKEQHFEDKSENSDDAQKSNLTNTEKEVRKQKGAARRRAKFADLPPDRQQEISGRRHAQQARRQHVHRPAAPLVQKPIELHIPEIIIAYQEHFQVVNEYAVAMDQVADDRLQDRAAYNSYLQEFDQYLSNLSRVISEHHGRLERQSNGGLGESPKPFKEKAKIQSNRSMQMLQIFIMADQALRYSTFLSIFGDTNPDDHTKLRDEIVRTLKGCVKKLRKVKYRTFIHIIQEKRLDVKYRDNMKLDDVISIGTSNKSKTRRRERSRKPRIDPSAPGGELPNPTGT